jgi:hypothetical protein
LPTYSVAFRYRIAVQIWAAVFQLAERVTTTAGTIMNYFSILPNGALASNGKETLLIILSLVFPVTTAFIVGIIAVLTLEKKVEELRSNFFLSSIEGHRLNSIEMFRELSLTAYAFKTHVSRLAQSAPASANLQTRHTISLFRFFAMLEIGAKDPQDGSDHQQWYIKTRRSRYSLIDSFKNGLRQLCSVFTEYVPDGYNYMPLSSSADQKSFRCLFFKKVDTKFARRLIFPSSTLDNLKNVKLEENAGSATSTKEAHNCELLRELQVPDIVKRDTVEENLSYTMHQTKHRESTKISQRQVRVKVLPEAKMTKYEDRSHITVVVVPETNLDISNLHKGVGINFQMLDKITPFPREGSRRFVISKVIVPLPLPRKPAPGAAASCSADQICLQIELQCLDSTAFVDFESFYSDTVLIMNFDDPYVVDDDTIDWFKNADMLDAVKLKRLINYVIDDNPSHFKQEKERVRNLSRSSRTFPPQEMDEKATTPEKMEMDENEKTSEHETLKDPLLQFKTEYLLKFNPYAHRCDIDFVCSFGV